MHIQLLYRLRQGRIDTHCDVVIVCYLKVQSCMCLLTFSLDECKEFAVLLFIFAKCAAPFEGKNILLHISGATCAQIWCDQVAHSTKTAFALYNKAIGVPEWERRGDVLAGQGA
ncbi:hypothetical protein HV164_16245 [Citrobacter freundii]|uniref:Uncharacterized protein n=1 Tax=Citrobacter freundii TaxID=546 RepID=A0A7D6TV37_CITFR|nr:MULTISPECIES: hypothetical protein [Citrobacter]EJB8472493.1 hypothetical protein [Citrobacter freundii]EJB8557600.1 hypothetical protein [Citrobacter freundii]MBA7729171.1 hypothetical protein [Citrobacter freundii]MBA8032801.1 hypothetical protein [Citrobacter freundii]MBA8062730.1 hypothetical protein [Citrobacter freundii]